MKTKLIVLAVTLIVCGASGVIGWSNRPVDVGQIKRERTDKLMRQNYGDDWFKVLVGCERTNRVQLNAMRAAYKSAMGLRPAK